MNNANEVLYGKITSPYPIRTIPSEAPSRPLLYGLMVFVLVSFVLTPYFQFEAYQQLKFTANSIEIKFPTVNSTIERLAIHRTNQDNF